uniref:ATP synthase subunit a n=1 Tax=Discolomatidae sp. 1 ACP-2013 TaxID=1434484 RepID=A0A3G5FND1_9CUCU|nr:ATP synthase F0 subunit 6 [Discolomatidae sp. 1 ACP-2013]
MMSNLFSSFDPMTNLNMPLNWISSLIFIMMIIPSFWFIPSYLNMFILKISMILYKEMKILNNSFSTMMYISLFWFILINNFMGLFPYIFTSSSHMIFTLTLSLPFWISFMLFGWIMNTKHMLAHLIPMGTPSILMPFMVCIETISNLIRPGTLAIRLSANMIAGHLLLTLLGNSGSSMSLFMLNILIITQIFLLTLELAVSLIQSYVFTILSILYCSEIK